MHETNLSSSSAASLDGYVATSASIVDSLLMPMKATGDTRVVGNDVIVIRDPFAFRHAYANFVRAGPGRLQVRSGRGTNQRAVVHTRVSAR